MNEKLPLQNMQASGFFCSIEKKVSQDHKLLQTMRKYKLWRVVSVKFQRAERHAAFPTRFSMAVHKVASRVVTLLYLQRSKLMLADIELEVCTISGYVPVLLRDLKIHLLS